jgi:hypothetical protein
MAVIVIKDLSENMDLDREAMTAILGGSRTPRSAFPKHMAFRSSRMVNYPGAVMRNSLAGMPMRTLISTPRK